MITPVLLVSLLMTIFCFSLILWKDNIFFRFAAVTAIAGAVGNATVMGIRSLQSVAFKPLMQGKIILIIPILLGLTIFSTLKRGYSWIGRPAYAIIIGVGTGSAIRSSLLVSVRTNIIQTMKPLIGGVYTPFDNLVSIIFVVSIMTYFLFTIRRRETGVLKYVGDLGRNLMMFGMGTNFGIATITRFTWLGGRVFWILQTLGIL